MKRVAIYARYSSDLQSPSSIEDQIRLCRAHAERHGWSVEATFEDRALSGVGVEHRPGYQQLLAAALSSRRPFDLVLVEDLSRLTREIGESDLLYRRLRLRGIDLVGVADGVDTSRRGASAHIALKGVMNALYLEDLTEKTHRGLAGGVARGLSAGGRLFGYRTVPLVHEARPGSRKAPARFEIEPTEGNIVRRIFRDYAAGRSMRTIAHALNADGIAFPAKDTKRGPSRRGWAVSTIHVILRNEKYAGVWVWNKTRFLKDPDSGRRRPIPRPIEEWIRQERPELRILEPALWESVQSRLRVIEQTYAHGGDGRLRGRSAAAYSPYLLSGILRCGVCTARMVAATTTRRKNGAVHRYGWYQCAFAVTKGPAVCRHRVGYRREHLEAALLARFREAMTPARIDALAAAVNARIEAACRRHDARANAIKAEVLALEAQAGNLVRFLAGGGESTTVRQELHALEAALRGRRLELADVEREVHVVPPRVHRTWILARLRGLEELLRKDPARAKIEIAKHLDGDLTISPRPSVAGERRAEIAGRVNANGLLAEQEAVRLSVVAGAGYAECYTEPERYWLDLR